MKATVQPSAGMQLEPSLTLYSFEKQNRKGSVEKAQWGIVVREAVHKQQPGAALQLWQQLWPGGSACSTMACSGHLKETDL